MSEMFSKPKVEKPKPVKEVALTQVQDRGAVGRTILAGNTDDENRFQKKSILGG